MNEVDAALWALAAVLLAAALLVQAGQARPWDPAAFFAAALAALRVAEGVAAVPLRGGPIPAEGWDGDHDALDPELDPEARLGPGLTWASLGSADTLQAIERRTSAVRLVWFEPACVQVDGLRAEVVPLASFDAAAAFEALAPLLEGPETRLVLAARAHADALLRALADAPGLRDRLRAVLLVGASLDAAWLQEHFTHVAFDVEVQREVPYVTLRLPGATALPQPALPPTARASIAVVDLGEIDPDALARPSTARALGALVAAIG